MQMLLLHLAQEDLLLQAEVMRPARVRGGRLLLMQVLVGTLGGVGT